MQGSSKGSPSLSEESLSKPILKPGAVALVAGASAGIGAAIAEALAAKGARVICASRNLEKLEALVGQIGERGHAVELDVTDPGSVESLLRRLPETLRGIDVLVACAGHDIGGRRRFDHGEVADWAGIIETNVTGMIRVCHAVVPGMLERGRGHVVTLGSVAGLNTYPGGTIYGASKFAVRAFTEALRADYKATPLRITEILPGLVRTEFAATRLRGDRAKGAAFYDAAPQALAPGDIARCVVFALEQPPQVTIAQLVVVPTNEA
jgi:NADP-dependent 3-hydroxy acid dehydrogenase YdfG